ncbi:MAG: FAD-dependent oxidoreductase [Desulfovibrio sp.]|jgi:NADPH-dependent 2,4-dienoyl-CoA reductase/sulfur reductase-like enzyme/rhodanese-related sulfurtransferase|nr:FAD-dependent oxidoreductase [Desulfovibrio sp.]
MSIRVVVIGAVALGPKAASRCKRLLPDAEVVLIDQGSRISYGGCGIPYFVSGEVNRVEELQSTPYGAIRDADFFKSHKGVTAMTRTRCTAVNPAAKTVTVENVDDGAVSTIGYDKLVLATGSSPNRPPIPGIELEGIGPATNLDEAEAIRAEAASGKINNAVVVGGGFIGLELAVALGDMWGIPAAVVELTDQILPNFLSGTLARMAAKDLTDNGVSVYTAESVQRFEGENGRVTKVVTNKREIPADLVIMAAGVRPNSRLAKDAGLVVTDRGLIVVNEKMETSDPDIYAGGDCVTITNQVTGKPGWYPLGSMANRQGRVIGSNIAGGDERFPGAVGSWGVKLFEQNAAGAGLTLESALREGFDAVKAHVEQIDKAHFYPEKNLMVLELVVDAASRRVLGIQGMCADGNALAARVNAVAPLLSRGALVEDISNLEVLYSPPFAAAMDIVNVAGNVADNILGKRLNPMSQEEFERRWAARADKKDFFVDARVARDAAPMLDKYPDDWHSIPQDQIAERLDEIPKDKEVVLVCNTGLRSFEAQLNLDAAGRKDARSVMGGISSAKRLGIDI